LGGTISARGPEDPPERPVCRTDGGLSFLFPGAGCGALEAQRLSRRGGRQKRRGGNGGGGGERGGGRSSLRTKSRVYDERDEDKAEEEGQEPH
jgi:hypothetical protein